jgi:hypothetical protein
VRTSYIVFGVLMVVQLGLVMASPETVDASMAELDRPVRFALRPGFGVVFGAAAALGFFAFAVMGLFSSLGAIIVRGELGITSYFVAGLAPFTALAASSIGQVAVGRASQAVVLRLGTVLFPVGLALTAVSLYRPMLWLVLVAAALAGSGAGLLFKSAVTQTVIAAEPASRAGVLASFFVISYVGMGLPSIAFSQVIQHVALKPSMIGFAVVLSIGAIVAVRVALSGSRRPGGSAG